MKVLVVSEGKPHSILAQLEALQPAVEVKCVNPKQALGLYHRFGPDWVLAPSPWLESWLKALRDPEAMLPRVQLQSRTHQGIQVLAVSDILYFQAEDKYVNAVGLHGHLLLEDTLTHLEEEFASQFIRIHRKTLIYRQAFLKLEKNDEGHYQVYLKGLPKPLAVSRRQLSKLRKWLKSLESTGPNTHP